MYSVEFSAGPGAGKSNSRKVSELSDENAISQAAKINTTKAVAESARRSGTRDLIESAAVRGDKTWQQIRPGTVSKCSTNRNRGCPDFARQRMKKAAHFA